MVEAFSESIPQFIIQLHATIVLQEQVSTIQMISLCASFLSIAWTYADNSVRKLMSLEGVRKIDSGISKIITTVAFYVSWLFHLSSRLLAITFFTVGFKWWAIAVFVFQFIVLVAFYIVWRADIMIILSGLKKKRDNKYEDISPRRIYSQHLDRVLPGTANFRKKIIMILFY